MAKVAVGAAFSSVSGSFGGTVVSNSASGLVLRKPARYAKYQNPAQQGSARRLALAAAAWRGMGFEHAAAWDDYAQTLTLHNSLTGQPFHPSGYNTFIGLATKVLQVDPSAEISITPPTGEFVGDNITVMAVATLGAVRFTASGPDSAGTVVELLLERLPNPRRKPAGKMASCGFHQFSGGSLSVDVPVEPGCYLAATRFVEPATGRQTMVLIAGRVEVV